MNFKKYFLFNYRNFVSLALISILFLSCQSDDPFGYFQKESHSIGYKKITNIQEDTDFSFGENSILNIESENNLGIIMPDIKSFSECEIYYCYFDKKSYTLLIVCKGLGESFKRKIIKEKGITDFDYKQAFSDSKWFVTPIDANNVMISTDVSDIRKAIKRSKDQSVIFNEILFGLKHQIPQTSSEWFITNDEASISLLFKPFIKDSLSSLDRIQKNFNSLIFFKEEKFTLLIEGSVDEETDNNIINEIKSELSSLDYVRDLTDSKNYNFSKINISSINNKFNIKIN
jgi:hypothetical protein